MTRLKYARTQKYSITSAEQILLDKLTQGEKTAFWQLWELHREYLYHRCVNWMGGNHFDAEEVMSLASIKAWRKLPKYARNITNLKGWLNRFVHNLCVDLHRQRRRQAFGIENVEDLTVDRSITFNSNSELPESNLLQQELKIYLRYCVEDLPLRLRQPIVMFYYQQMSYAEIAHKLSISQANLGKRLQQARQLLKKQVMQYYSGLDTQAIDEGQFQQLEQQDFSTPIHIHINTQEINERITVSCLENLPPVWCSFPQI